MWRTAIVGVLVVAASRAQVTQRVSVDSSGAQGNGGSALPAITPDGRYVVFASQASNLVSGDTNGVGDIFVRDRVTGTTERVSVSSSGGEANAASGTVSISADGRYVAFESGANNLVPGDTNGYADVFVRDRLSGTTERVSVSTGGTQGNYHCFNPWISADGRYVAFESEASNLVPGDTNGRTDIFVRDRIAGTTERVSVSSSGMQANEPCTNASISADGRYVAFQSFSQNLIRGGTLQVLAIFVHDRQTGTTELVSVNSSGVEANGDSNNPSISADGRCVVFESEATNLDGPDTNTVVDIFVRDRVAGTTQRVSVDSSGVEEDGDGFSPSISADDRYVAFSSYGDNLVSGDTNMWGDVFVRDRIAGTTVRVSVDSGGAEGNDISYPYLAAISANGNFVAFTSRASNLVSGDTNGTVDVFVHDQGSQAMTSLCDPGIGGVIACPCSNPPGGPDSGCDNSAATGGAVLAASGDTHLSSDDLVFTTSGEKATATSVLLQGSALVPGGVVYGQGVRCVAGTLHRLFTKHATAGSVMAPDFGAGDLSVSAQSAALGEVILPGQSRWYLVFYRDPVVLGGCPSGSTFNATQTGQVTWQP